MKYLSDDAKRLFLVRFANQTSQHGPLLVRLLTTHDYFSMFLKDRLQHSSVDMVFEAVHVDAKAVAQELRYSSELNFFRRTMWHFSCTKTSAKKAGTWDWDVVRKFVKNRYKTPKLKWETDFGFYMGSNILFFIFYTYKIDFKILIEYVLVEWCPIYFCVRWRKWRPGLLLQKNGSWLLLENVVQRRLDKNSWSSSDNFHRYLKKKRI